MNAMRPAGPTTRFWNRESGTGTLGTSELLALQTEIMTWLRSTNHPETGFAARWLDDCKTDKGRREWIATLGPMTQPMS